MELLKNDQNTECLMYPKHITLYAFDTHLQSSVKLFYGANQ